MFAKFSKNEILSILIVLIIAVVIGTNVVSLHASGIPFYGQHITDAKATKVLTQMNALVQYAKSYISAHPDDWASPGKLLGSDANGTAVFGDGDWIEQIVSNRSVYFDYDYVAASRQIRAWGKKAPFSSNDRLTATLSASGSVSFNASGKLQGVM